MSRRRVYRNRTGLRNPYSGIQEASQAHAGYLLSDREPPVWDGRFVLASVARLSLSPVLGIVGMIFFRTEMASFGTVRFAVQLSCFDDHRPVWQAGHLTIVRNPVPPIVIG